MPSNLFASALEKKETFSFFRGLENYELKTPDHGVVAAGHISHVKSYLDQSPEQKNVVFKALSSYLNNSGFGSEDFRFVLANVYSFANFENKSFNSFLGFSESEVLTQDFANYLNKVKAAGLTQEHEIHLKHYFYLSSKLVNSALARKLGELNANE